MNRTRNPRLWLFIGIVIFAGTHLLLIRHYGWVDTWRWWHVPSRAVPFSDLRVITGASDSVERGYNPREINPGAPYGQRFNQTHVWLWMGELGLRERHSPVVGGVLLAGYLVGIWWLAAGIGGWAMVLLVPLLISPAALLAVERGTTDLSVFFLLALAGHLAGRALRGSLVAVLVGFLLKLFPLAGVLLVLREPRARAWRLGAGVLVLAALFGALNFHELVDIAHKTEKGGDTSYGWAVLSLYLERFPGAAAYVLPVRELGAMLAVVGLAVAWWSARGARDEAAGGRPLDFFRMGAGVYAGTFLLGASWDYRFIFGLFMIPQLALWLKQNDAHLRRIAGFTLAVLFLAAWSRAFTDWLEPISGGKTAVRTLEELAKWTLFFACIHLLTRTAPSWLQLRRAISPAGV